MSVSATPACFRHLDRLAVEHCEVCKRPVCGACLWYAESGERLCPDHATEWLQAGKAVTPPERYAEGIHHSQRSAAAPPQPDLPYKGNSTDVMALAAAITGLASLLSCGGFYYFLPLIALVLGLIAWLQAKDAHDPGRARWLGVVGLAGGSVFILSVLAIMALFGLCFFLQFALISSPGPSFPTPLPPPTP